MSVPASLPPGSLPDLPADLPARPDDLTETVVQHEEVFKGNFLRVARDAVRLPTGAMAGREFVYHAGAVVVVAQLQMPNAEPRYVVEYQYRHPVGRAMIEFPAGKLDPQEPGLHCARRELREETGFDANQWAFAGTMHNCIGYSDEHIDIWFARDLQWHGQKLDDGELLRVYAATLPDLLRRVQDGSLTDAKTITALLWLQQVASGAWPLQWQAVDCAG